MTKIRQIISAEPGTRVVSYEVALADVDDVASNEQVGLELALDDLGRSVTRHVRPVVAWALVHDRTGGFVAPVVVGSSGAPWVVEPDDEHVLSYAVDTGDDEPVDDDDLAGIARWMLEARVRQSRRRAHRPPIEVAQP